VTSHWNLPATTLGEKNDNCLGFLTQRRYTNAERVNTELKMSQEENFPRFTSSMFLVYYNKDFSIIQFSFSGLTGHKIGKGKVNKQIKFAYKLRYTSWHVFPFVFHLAILCSWQRSIKIILVFRVDNAGVHCGSHDRVNYCFSGSATQQIYFQNEKWRFSMFYSQRIEK
jgi:hypothetical protein